MIKVENISKRYIIGHDRKASGMCRYKSLRDSLAHGARSLFQRLRHPLSPNRETTEMEEFWALREINFEIRQGERVGIIGRNGAGKSTLLKILSRITEPTTGRITLRGRVASLLEVGTGFHPELSGRENIFLNGAVLGMTRAEIKRKFDEIVAFAEVEKFLDTPVKRYSSGMYVRLAFAVAAHLEPEILLVDEVLAVGDAAFQKKCLGKMSEVSREGRTVLFVSHNMAAIRQFCVSCLYLSAGKLAARGKTEEIVGAYLGDMFAKSSRKVVFTINAKTPISILGLDVVPIAEDADCGELPLDVSLPFQIRLAYRVNQALSGMRIGIAVKKEGDMVFRSWDIDRNPSLLAARPCGDYSASLRIEPFILGEGRYSISAVVVRENNETTLLLLDCAAFELEDLREPSINTSRSVKGALLSFMLPWSVKQIT